MTQMVPPEAKDLECLILWPKDTIGYWKEQNVINTLNDLCQIYGYGRIPQLAAAIQEIWDDTKAIEKYKAHRKNHLEMCGYPPDPE